MEILIPDLGDFDAVQVIEVLVKPGDTVAINDPLITLETDKAAMDVPATAAGRIVDVRVQVGDRVAQGHVVAVLETEAKAGETPQPAAKPAEAAPAPVAKQESQSASQPSQPVAANQAAQQPQAPVKKSAQKPSARQRAAVVVPDLGDFDQVDVIEVLVAVGDEVAMDQGLATLETEKAAMDVPSPHAGRVVALRIKPGDKVRAGDVVAEIESAADAPSADSPAVAQPQPAASDTVPASAAVAAPQAAASTADAKDAQRPAPAGAADESAKSAPRAALAAVDEKAFAKAHASPAIRKIARELGVDLGRVTGSGDKGRVTGDDVKRWVREFIASGGADARGSGLPALPKVDFSKFGATERLPLTRIQKISGTRLHAVWVNVPHVTHHDSSDITRLEEARLGLKGRADELGIKLTPLAFILRACVLALCEFPRFNASLDADGEHLIVKKYMHLGFAADTPNGLVVPVIRDADQMDVFALAAALGDLSAKARDGKLKGAEMQGGCFSVSSLGGIGGTGFTPIINAPEVAILGVARSRIEPQWDAEKKAFEPRLMLPLSLSYDHRVIDGAQAARFTRRLCEMLSSVELLLGSKA